MSDDLDFNIKMGNDNDKTRLSSNAQSSSSGYKMSNQSSKSGYQAPTSQNDPESSHNNIEENLSLFDIRQAGHPMACLFTFLFKVLGMVSYLFMGTTTLVFITVVLAAAADFWTVKNITGRLLVGLRWWSDIQQDGTEKWHFESHDQRVKLHPIDRRVFWWSQTVACIFWAVIVLLKILGLSLYWGTCAGICLTLSVVNYWGYYKCSKDHQKKLNTLFRNTALSGLRRGLGF